MARALNPYVIIRRSACAPRAPRMATRASAPRRSVAPTPAEARANESRVRLAVILIALVCLANVAALALKLLPPLSSPWLEAIRQDTYYCVLVPLTLPILAFFNYLHWLSYSFFTNN